ncbi:MAG TPA: hypothetical protein VEI03_09280 [Stellaceae bacterium]|nr:hypothetical protein [Stellaceae bacterium]
MDLPWAIVLGSFAFAAAAVVAADHFAATHRQGAADQNRYAMVEAPGGAGVWRLDQRTGQVSLCTLRDKGMACVHVAQEVDAVGAFLATSGGSSAGSVTYELPHEPTASGLASAGSNAPENASPSAAANPAPAMPGNARNEAVQNMPQGAPTVFRGGTAPPPDPTPQALRLR